MNYKTKHITDIKLSNFQSDDLELSNLSVSGDFSNKNQGTEVQNLLNISEVAKKVEAQTKKWLSYETNVYLDFGLLLSP